MSCLPVPSKLATRSQDAFGRVLVEKASVRIIAAGQKRRKSASYLICGKRLLLGAFVFNQTLNPSRPMSVPIHELPKQDWNVLHVGMQAIKQKG
jgi:hypothetical protein